MTKDQLQKGNDLVKKVDDIVRLENDLEAMKDLCFGFESDTVCISVTLKNGSIERLYVEDLDVLNAMMEGGLAACKKKLVELDKEFATI